METIRGSRCPRCGWMVVPPVRICPKHPVETEPVDLPAYGFVLSYTTLTSAPEGFKAPLQIAVVEIPGGARIFCHGKQGRDLKIGRRVLIEQVDGIFYFAQLNLADRVVLFWKRGGNTRTRATGAVKGTAKRLVALASAFRQAAVQLTSTTQSDDDDLIEARGHEVSALEIEEQLRQHPFVADCAVVGVSDPSGGKAIAAAVVLRNGSTAVDAEGIRCWVKQRLAWYKVPSRFLIVPSLPRDPMGKVTKRELADLFKDVPGSDAA